MAISNDLPLYTCNPRDFEHMDGLDLRSVPHPDGVASHLPTSGRHGAHGRSEAAPRGWQTGQEVIAVPSPPKSGGHGQVRAVLREPGQVPAIRRGVHAATPTPVSSRVVAAVPEANGGIATGPGHDDGDPGHRPLRP